MHRSVSPPPPSALRFLLGHTDGRRVAVLLALNVGVALTDSVGVLSLVPVLGQLQSGSSGDPPIWLQEILGFTPSILDLIGVMLVLAGLRAALGYSKQIQTLAVQNEIAGRLRVRAFKAVIDAEWRWLAERRGADHANLVITTVARVGLGLNQLLNAGALAIMAGGYLAAAFLLSWRLALLTIILGALVLALFATHRSRTIGFGFAVGQASRTVQATVQQAFAGVRVLKAYGVEDEQARSFAGAVADLNDQSLRAERLGARGQAMLQVGGVAALLVVLGVGQLVVGVPLPTLLPLLLVFARLAPMLATFQMSWTTWNYALPAVIEMRTFLVDAEGAREPRDAAIPTLALSRNIEFHDVGVGFAGRDLPALEGITLTLPANSTTALCGASGAGKSTFADVLMGLIAPDRGQVLVDGAALEGEARTAWRRSVAYVQQDPFLFHDTIGANILLGREDIPTTDVKHALERAGAAFVLRLPQGLETVVGDGGVRLSGGERQRIALARALVGSPALIILDEATSALDPEHERAVRGTMQALRGQVTLLFISHRASMREDADQVVFLDHGRLACA